MKRLLVSLFLVLILNTLYLILYPPPLAEASVAPTFKAGGTLCGNSTYSDRASPACYVTQGSTSTYNLYLPQFPRDGAGNDPQIPWDTGDPNVSQTCFTVQTSHTLTQPANYTPGYQLVTDTGTIMIDTRDTQWPWDIPQEKDYRDLTLSGKMEQFIADTFWQPGTTRTPTLPHPDILVDQYGPLEKLQPLLFQVKDRLDYCQLLDDKQIFDEPVNYVTDNKDKTLLLSQICSAIPASVRRLPSDLSTPLTDWYQTDPDSALAFHQITPYSQQDQVAWMIIYLYQYEYSPLDGPRRIKTPPLDQAIVKLHLPGLTRASQAEQRLKQVLIPAGLTPDTAVPQGFPITSQSQLAALQDQALVALSRLGYANPQDCDVSLPLPDSEFEPGPPTGGGILEQVAQSLTQATCVNFGGYDAVSCNAAFVGRCSPPDWHRTFDDHDNPTGWQCTTSAQVLANVYLLNPEYLKQTCNEFYLAPGGSLRAFLPSGLAQQQDSDVPPPSPKPLLPTFKVFGGDVSSPGKPNSAQVDLPTVCQGELARAKSLSLLGKALRPQEFINQPRQGINEIYKTKRGLSQTLRNTLGKLFPSLLPAP